MSLSRLSLSLSLDNGQAPDGRVGLVVRRRHVRGQLLRQQGVSVRAVPGARALGGLLRGLRDHRDGRLGPVWELHHGGRRRGQDDGRLLHGLP